MIYNKLGNFFQTTQVRRLREIQRQSVLAQNYFSSVSALFIAWKSWNSDYSALNSAENENFQC